MRAIIFDGKLRYMADYPVPINGEGEALIRVTLAGVCNTDLEIIKGYMGFQGVLGHEFVGVVERCRDSSLIGKRVVGEINMGCGRCGYCTNGMQNHCPSRSVLGILNRDGAFAEYATLPVSNLHLVPDSVTDEEAVFVEPLAAAFEITEQVNIRPDHRVCILGDGKLGLLTAQVLALTGSRLICIGRHEEKLAILGKRGIETNSTSAGYCREFDLVVDCSGSPKGLESAINLVKPKGTIVLKTTAAKREAIDMNSLVINEITLLGSRCGPFSPAIEALAEKYVDVRPMISRVFPLEEGVEAVHQAAAKGVVKVLIRI